MQTFIRAVLKSSKFMNVVGGAILVFMMLLTVFDVVLRWVGTPIAGTYELMGYCGALVIGFALAQTSLDDANVTMDILTQRLPPMRKDVLLVITKVACLILFIFISWSLFLKGCDLQEGKEVSPTLRVPFYPVAYALAVCGFLECIVLLCDVIRIVVQGGENE